MTTMNISDISHKKRVSAHYQPNSYRIFCEDIGNDDVPVKYVNTAPEIYSHPPVLPAQAIEDRNRPHGGRAAGFLRENTRTLNEPVAVVNGLSKEAEKRWWEWNTLAQDDDPNWKSKKRSNSSANLQNLKDRAPVASNNGGDGFQTTYQKEHGYMTTEFYRKPGSLASVQGGMMRHTNNPNTIQATGIVPVTEHKNYVPDNQERVLVDKMSFEHGYDSRETNNYPQRGKRQGAFVIEQVEPKPIKGTKHYPDMNKGTSVWDCMHHDAAPGENNRAYQKTFSAKSNVSETRGQRRDPIGYFEETKYSEAPQQRAPPNGAYMPSWTNDVNSYQQQQPIDLMSNGYNNHQMPYPEVNA